MKGCLARLSENCTGDAVAVMLVVRGRGAGGRRPGRSRCLCVHWAAAGWPSRGAEEVAEARRLGGQRRRRERVVSGAYDFDGLGSVATIRRPAEPATRATWQPVWCLMFAYSPTRDLWSMFNIASGSSSGRPMRTWVAPRLCQASTSVQQADGSTGSNNAAASTG